MKKISLYSMSLLLGASLVACDDYKEPNPPAQSNKPVPVLQASEVTETPVLSNETYNLEEIYNAGKVLDIATVSCDNLAEGYTFGGYGFISVDDFENYAEVPMYSTKSADANVWTLYVEPKALSEVYRENISPRDNDEATIQFHFQLTTVYALEQGDQVALVGGADTYFGPYDIKILPFEFTISSFEYLYTPGGANNWSQTNSQMLFTDLDSADAFNIYKGFAVFNGEYKYCSATNWDDGLNLGAGEEEGTLSSESDAGNITVDQNGLYFSEVSINDLTYSNYFVESIGIIGSATPNEWNASTPLVSDDYLVWTGTVYLIPGAYKFRCNDAWDVDLGGAADNLNFGSNGAGDIEFTGEEGTYVVTLDLSSLPYTCTLEAAE